MNDDDLDLDIATLLIRLQQIDDEKRPEHFLWDRVMTCDVPRLMRQLSGLRQQEIVDIRAGVL